MDNSEEQRLAKIAEEAGFPAIWGSGLSISAQIGFRDANEASPNQVIEVADFINQAVSAPVLLDGDTGFGKCSLPPPPFFQHN